MLWFFLFLFGLAIGSFLDVVAMRYDGERFLLSTHAIGGRSHCEHCKKTLRWFELIPLFSFIVQGGRCLHCKAPLSVQYPIIELISGLIFVFVPFALGVSLLPETWIVSGIWILAFEALFVMSLIDMRLGIIPDEICIFLLMLGIGLAIGSNWENHIIAAVAAGLFFGFLILITRGKGMGLGDLKLVVPLGLMFGYPGILVLLLFAFLIGAIAGLIQVGVHRNTMKGTIPFGPFLAIGSMIAFFWGPMLVSGYLSLLGL